MLVWITNSTNQTGHNMCELRKFVLSVATKVQFQCTFEMVLKLNQVAENMSKAPEPLSKDNYSQNPQIMSKSLWTMQVIVL